MSRPSKEFLAMAVIWVLVGLIAGSALWWVMLELVTLTRWICSMERIQF